MRADSLKSDGLFTDEGRARRWPRLGPQGPGMSRFSGLLDPEARAYFEAIEAAVRPGRHQPERAGIGLSICSGKQFGAAPISA
ncbi:DUF222 domain-containing protein [Mycobacterium interjectum]|nr:hypothetical protein AWC11_08205 [Mycobacterium interjectum]